MLRGVQDLKNGQPSSNPDFFGFENWSQVVEFAKSGEGEHLLTFVNLVESRGEKRLMWALAHKAKGREWARVRLMDDFLRSRPRQTNERHDKKHDDAAELRLFYVALTRAPEKLEIAPELMAIAGLEGATRPMN